MLLGGLALSLGALAASDVAGREAALRRDLGPPASGSSSPGASCAPARRSPPGDLAVRRVPGPLRPGGRASATRGRPRACGPRWTSPPAPTSTRPARRRAPRRRPGPRCAPGERLAQLDVAGAAAGVGPGARVDVLVTRDGRGGAAGRTVLALEDVEVARGAGAGRGRIAGRGGPALAVTLRVTLRQAVYLAAAQSFAREVRVLPRGAGDRRRGRGRARGGEDL